MFNVAEYKHKTDRLSDLLPWAIMCQSGIILNKDGSFQQSLRFRGPDLESSTPSQLVSATARLNNALKRLGSGWAIFIEARRQQALSYPEEGHFPDPVSWLLDAERRDSFEAEKQNFESHYFLTFVYLPPKETLSKLSNWMVVGSRSHAEHDYDKLVDFFRSTVIRLYDILSDFMYEVRYLDDEETLTYLHDCISPKRQVIRMPDVPAYLDAFLADTPLTAGLEPRLGDDHIRIVSVMGFPSTSVPAILDQLNHLPIEYRWVTRYLPLDKVDAEKTLKSYKKKWFSKRKGLLSLVQEVFSRQESAMVDTAALRKSQDSDAALQELADDHVSFGYYTATIVVWDKNADHVDEKQREIERVINGLGFTTIAETINSVDAWLSSLPGHCNANVRMPMMHSLNLAHVIPFSAVWAGPDANQHLKAPPLMYVRTKGNTPFRLSNHIGDVGHQMVIGPTGSGKSVLLNMMALQFLRYEAAQVIVFDKGGSFLVSTHSVGGTYYEVGSQEKGGLVFQPLMLIDQMDERIWAHEWVLGLLTNENIDIVPEIKEATWEALNHLSSVPKNQRTLTGLKAFIQDVRIRQALDTYCMGGPFGMMLDSDHENFYDRDWQCFEMAEIMSMPKVVAPVLSYIFHVIEKRLDGRPTMMILDEAWLFLDHPMFAHKIKAWLKTLRKQNVSVIFATQSVDDALNTDIASALIESCPSRIFLPNDRSLEPNVTDSYEALGLNSRQIEIIANATPKRQYYFESNHGNCLFEMGLGPLALAISSVSTPEEKAAFYELLNEGLSQPEMIKQYLHKTQLNWAWDIIESRYQDG